MGQMPKRLFRNYLLDRNFQLKYSVYFMFSGFLSTGILFFLLRNDLNQLNLLVESLQIDSPELSQSIDQLFYYIAMYSMALFIGNILFSVAFSIYMTHRVSGPAYVIENFVKDLTQGNYESKRGLRKGDDLQPIMASLRTLASILKAKDSGSKK